MKSFFKKLAFVMALAMVVSMAAPAAANAATVLYAAYQNTDNRVTELEMEVGQEIDLCFKGAPKGWRELNRGWNVTKGEGVVTVDNNGLVKAVANGEATIEFFMEGCESAVVTITVGEASAYEGYIQTYPDTVVFYMGEDLTDVKASAVKLFRVFTTVLGEEVVVSWPAKSISGNDKGQLTVQAFSRFADNGQYRITFGGEAYDFATVLPKVDEITFVETKFGTNNGAWWYDKNNYEAYVTEDGGDEEIVDLGYIAWYYDGTCKMDATSLFTEEVLSVEYELVTPDADSDDYQYINFDSNGTITFTEVVPAYVQAVPVYETEEGEQTITAVGIDIVPTKRPELAVYEVSGWTFHKTSKGDGKDFSWNQRTMPAGSSGYEIVLKIVDTRGNVYATHPAATKDAYNNPNGIIFLDLEDPSAATPLQEAGYSFKFKSTNVDDFLVHETSGALTTYKKLNDAVFYVEMYKENEETGEDEFVDNIFATDFDMSAPRKYDMIYPNVKTLNLVADAENAQNDATLVSGKVHIVTLDQYGSAWSAGSTGATNNYAGNFTVTCSNKDAKEDCWTIGNYYNDSNTSYNVPITINAAKLYEDTGKTAFTFTVTDTKKGFTTTFKVNIAKPNWVDRSTETTKSNVVSGYFTTGDVNNVETGLYTKKIIVDQISVKNAGDDVYYGHDKIVSSVEVDPFDWLGWDLENTYGGNSNYYREAEVTLYKTSSNQKIGYHDVLDYIVVDETDWADTTTGVIVDEDGVEHVLEIGDRIVALMKDGKVKYNDGDGRYGLTLGTNGVITVGLTGHDDEYPDTVTYVSAGTYQLVVYTVTSISQPDANGKITVKYEDDITTFNVDDNRAKPTFAKRTKLETSETSVKRIVLDALSFNLGGNAWGLSLYNQDHYTGGSGEADNSERVIQSVDASWNGDYVLIKSVTFSVPVDETRALWLDVNEETGEREDGEDYFSWTVYDINQSIKVNR